MGLDNINDNPELFTADGKLKKFNLQLLESSALSAYQEMVENPNEDTKSRLFSGIRDLAYAILSVGYKYRKLEMNKTMLAHEYGVHMYIKIVSGKLDLSGHVDKFPLQKYIDLNLQRVIDDVSKNESVDPRNIDIRYLTESFDSDGDSGDDSDEVIIKGNQSVGNVFIDYNVQLANGDLKDRVELSLHKSAISGHIFRGLRIFYDLPTIKRLLPIVLNGIDDGGNLTISLDDEAKKFWMTLISVSKRISTDHNIKVSNYSKHQDDFSGMFKSAIRSTMFLSMIANSDKFRTELLLSLDLDSLYRLATISGGKRIRVPTVAELDRLIAVATTLSNMVTENKPYKTSYLQMKKELDIVLNPDFVDPFLFKLKESFDVFGETKKSEPLLNVLSTVIDSMESLSKRIEHSLGSIESTELIEKYLELSNSFSSSFESLIKLRNQLSVSDFMTDNENDSVP